MHRLSRRARHLPCHDFNAFGIAAPIFAESLEPLGGTQLLRPEVQNDAGAILIVQELARRRRDDIDAGLELPLVNADTPGDPDSGK